MEKELLDLCSHYGVYVQLHKGNYLLFFGGFLGIGTTLSQAVEQWCTKVEQSGLLKNVESES